MTKLNESYTDGMYLFENFNGLLSYQNQLLKLRI